MKDLLTNLIENEYLEKYPSFKEFCLYKEKGLRKKAFNSLHSFIEEAKHWDQNQKKDFVSWLFKVFEKSENVHHILVHPLEENLLKPFLKEWMSEESKDPLPFRWYGLFFNTENRMKYLEKALEIGGKGEQRVLLKMIDMYFYSLWYSFHHISEDLYLGDVEEDKNILLKTEELCIDVKDVHSKKNVIETVDYYQNLLKDWIDFKSQDKEEFVKWCADNGKEYEWTDSYYY
ncbi:hypothetical protein QYG89_05975 [Bacillus sp. B190/17]|uniref:Uncharacterized protein n=1 Tax=Bacillus lumedeiriae TaxID=3058829 RepID=A0ABW8I710_9BACI